MGLYRYEGKLLVRGGALATSSDCCCGGPPPCVPCPENVCDFPAGILYDYLNVPGLNCQAFTTWDSQVYRVINKASAGTPGNPFLLPEGLSWKSGYPDALFGCTWASVVHRRLRAQCYQCGDEITNDGSEQQFFGQQSKFRIVQLVCAGGPESAEILDLTSDAVEGDVDRDDTVFQGNPGCSSTPFAVTPWLPFFPDPEPVCNEFP